jgi:2-amino-4,5-dihydroxy-6-oxo-7-(phosphonooxy)heptanoate synthase
VAQLAGSGVDAVVLHRGSVRWIDPIAFRHTALVVHLSASTVHATDPDAKYLVASVEGALRLGADAVSVHVNLGSAEEHRQVADLAATAEVCDRWSVPLLAMMYPRGPQIRNPRDPRLLAHAATLAADLGADLVKTPYAGSPAAMAEVVGACPIPLLAAGGPKLPDPDLLHPYVADVIRAGAAGVAMGRNIFQAADPGAVARGIAELVHPAPSPIDHNDSEVRHDETVLAGHP